MIKRLLVPQAIRPPLRQIIVGADGVEKVLAEGDVHSEMWNRFPDNTPRVIRIAFVKAEIPEDAEAEAGSVLAPRIHKEPEARTFDEVRANNMAKLKPEDDISDAQQMRLNAIAKAKNKTRYSR